MERLDQEVLKCISEAIQDTVQCPVCLSFLRPPVSQCANGHGICPDCKPQVDICPICRNDFIGSKSILLHQLLDALPKPCQFKTMGCSQFYVSGGQHENICGYRTVDCKMIECEWSGQARRMRDHILTSHQDDVVIIENAQAKSITWENFHLAEGPFKYIPFVAYDEVFWAYAHMNTEVKKLCICFKHIPKGQCDFQYFAIISFQNGHIGYTYTIKVPMDSNKMYTDFYEEDLMKIPESMLPRFINNFSSMIYSVNIVKEDLKEEEEEL